MTNAGSQTNLSQTSTLQNPAVRICSALIEIGRGCHGTVPNPNGKRCRHHEREHNALKRACKDKGILLDKFKEREREERSAGCGPEIALSLEIFNALD